MLDSEVAFCLLIFAEIGGFYGLAKLRIII